MMLVKDKNITIIHSSCRNFSKTTFLLWQMTEIMPKSSLKKG